MRGSTSTSGRAPGRSRPAAASHARGPGGGAGPPLSLRRAGRRHRPARGCGDRPGLDVALRSRQVGDFRGDVLEHRRVPRLQPRAHQAGSREHLEVACGPPPGVAAAGAVWSAPVNGAESLIRTVAAAGVDVCFANPGTTEMHLVQALDAVDGVRPVLGLFEGVCTAAADGYARMAGRPAITLLHLGPGMANGIANLHNASRARTPLLSVVGEHATTHRGRGAPLETDIEGLARPFSTWVRTPASPAEVARDAAAAVAAARSALGGVATLIVPADCAWGDAAAGPAHPIEAAPPRVVSDATVEA